MYANPAAHSRKVRTPGKAEARPERFHASTIRDVGPWAAGYSRLEIDLASELKNASRVRPCNLPKT